MNLNLDYLYTSFTGRINRATFWIGFVILLGVYIVAESVARTIFVQLIVLVNAEPSKVPGIIWQFVPLLALYPAAALLIKRGHDRGRPDIIVWVLLALVVFAKALVTTLVLNGIENSQNWVVGANLLISFIQLYLLIDYGFLQGQKGQNRYGEEPRLV